MRERVLAMRALWTQEAAAFHGQMVNFDPVWLYPKPLQQPHPPILLGGSSDYTLKRVVEFCDGWMPLARAGFNDPEGFNPKTAVARLQRAAEAAGRAFSTLSISAFGAPAEEAALEQYREAGIQRALLMIPDLSRDEILTLVDRYARLVH
jgi:alkanesulfonate monooxygenase SsuD/methylene tetrahydromethanopterin reductase-like flavin-dependent oxidoreductase (luciferase family)